LEVAQWTECEKNEFSVRCGT